MRCAIDRTSVLAWRCSGEIGGGGELQQQTWADAARQRPNVRGRIVCDKGGGALRVTTEAMASEVISIDAMQER